MELWDAYDADGRKIEGAALVRGEDIPEGMYHLVSDVLVRHRDGSYLLMRRDPRKKWGGMWEASAGGSALRGETAIDCALRELREETGIETEELEEVGRVLSRDTIYAEFLCVTDREKNAVTLQEGVTVAFRWASAEELLAMDRGELITSRMQHFIRELRGTDGRKEEKEQA